MRSFELPLNEKRSLFKRVASTVKSLGSGEAMDDRVYEIIADQWERKWVNYAKNAANAAGKDFVMSSADAYAIPKSEFLGFLVRQGVPEDIAKVAINKRFKNDVEKVKIKNDPGEFFVKMMRTLDHLGGVEIQDPDDIRGHNKSMSSGTGDSSTPEEEIKIEDVLKHYAKEIKDKHVTQDTIDTLKNVSKNIDKKEMIDIATKIANELNISVPKFTKSINKILGFGDDVKSILKKLVEQIKNNNVDNETIKELKNTSPTKSEYAEAVAELSKELNVSVSSLSKLINSAMKKYNEENKTNATADTNDTTATPTTIPDQIDEMMARDYDVDNIDIKNDDDMMYYYISYLRSNIEAGKKANEN